MTTDRAFLIHYARVQLAQSRHFREREQRLGWSGRFSTKLLKAAGSARRRAMLCCRPMDAQADLFGGE